MLRTCPHCKTDNPYTTAFIDANGQPIYSPSALRIQCRAFDLAVLGSLVIEYIEKQELDHGKLHQPPYFAWRSPFQDGNLAINLN